MNNNTTIKLSITIIPFIIFVMVSNLNRSSVLFIPMYIFSAIFYSLFIVVSEKNKLKLNKNIFWLFTIAIRIFVMFFPIGLSDDVYRYMWDGYVQHLGFNPYLYAPNSNYLSIYRTTWWQLINNNSVPTPYPPFSQLLFYLFYIPYFNINQNIIIFRVIILIMDLVAIKLIGKILELLEKPARQVQYYAFSPLVLIELVGNAHNDVIAIVLMLLSIIFHIKGVKTNNTHHEYIRSSFFIALAILTKTFPIVILAFLIYKWRFKEFLAFITTFSLLTMVYYLPGINPLFPPGQRIFVQYFIFNNSMFKILDIIAFAVGINVRLIYVTIMFFIVIALSVTYHLKLNNDYIHDGNLIVDYSTIIFLSALLLGPDVQPWYILWVLPLATVKLDRTVIVYSITVVLSYFIYIKYDSTGIWQENTSILVLEYMPIYLMLIYTILRFVQFQTSKS